MLQVVLIQSGATEFDEQGRIKGTLDIPLSEKGALQVARTCEELSGHPIQAVYSAPGQCSVQTAEAVARGRDTKLIQVGKLQNLDHGLWHGKLIQEVKQQQPKVYRQWQDHPETVCPPQGEPFQDATARVRLAIQKILKKHNSGMIAIIVPEPITSIVRSMLSDTKINDMWKVECDGGHWERIEVGPEFASV
ncbi:MAG: broad specificity phosphatase PhoE [Pirellulaceae bacterium]|jgi:broad specificity phosphatase PhoE